MVARLPGRERNPYRHTPRGVRPNVDRLHHEAGRHPVAEPPGGRLWESERAELERLRAEARDKGKRIRELEMERDVCKRFVALWVK